MRMEELILLLQSERTINRSGGTSAQTRDTCNAMMHEGHARSRQGVQQGRPASPLLFVPCLTRRCGFGRCFVNWVVRNVEYNAIFLFHILHDVMYNLFVLCV